MPTVLCICVSKKNMQLPLIIENKYAILILLDL